MQPVPRVPPGPPEEPRRLSVPTRRASTAGEGHRLGVRACPPGDRRPHGAPGAAGPPHEQWEAGAAEPWGRPTQCSIRITRFSCETCALRTIMIGNEYN